jgi:hypothetical protein
VLTTWKPDLVVAFGAPGRVLQWGGFAALSALALTPSRRFGLSRLVYGLLLTAGTAGLFAVNMMSNSKAYLMFCALPTVWLCIMRPGMRKYIPILGISGIVFYLTVLSPVMALSRLSPLDPGETYASRLLDTFELFVENGGKAVEGVSVRDYGEALLYRQFDPLPLGFFIGEVQNSGFQNGSSMAYVGYALVPRILWPSKPNVTRGAWFAYYIGFAESEETATVTLGLTAAGELYWNFGIPAVVIGMFLIGAMLGRLWRMAGDNPLDDPVRMLLYVMVMLNMGNMAEAVTVLTFIVSGYLAFWGVLFAQALLRNTGGRRMPAAT